MLADRGAWWVCCGQGAGFADLVRGQPGAERRHDRRCRRRWRNDFDANEAHGTLTSVRRMVIWTTRSVGPEPRLWISISRVWPSSTMSSPVTTWEFTTIPS